MLYELDGGVSGRCCVYLRLVMVARVVSVVCVVCEESVVLCIGFAISYENAENNKNIDTLMWSR